MTRKYVIGIDYGTDSVRSVVVDTADGKIAGTSVFEYPRWKKGLFVILRSTSSGSIRLIILKGLSNQ